MADDRDERVSRDAVIEAAYRRAHDEHPQAEDRTGLTVMAAWSRAESECEPEDTD